MIHIEEVPVILMLMFGVVVSCTVVSVTLWYSDALQKCTVRSVSILIYLALLITRVSIQGNINDIHSQLVQYGIKHF